ncbi:MAG: TetR/AcrR family transcriptional regulator [Solirubrobacteraceae bacterium]|nr:TetR/AcrR family transcriptional regulator [Solirubrobacteraceae bacterium]
MSGGTKKAKPAKAGAGKGADGGRRNGDERGRRRDAEVLAAATKVFHEKTYADSSVQDVADELGILKGSLYHYIRTKEDLLSWLLDDVHDDVEEILQEVLATEDLAPLDRLEAFVRRQIEFNVRNLPRITVYYHDADQLGEERAAELRQRRRAHERALVQLVRAAQEQGGVAEELDARTLTQCVYGTMTWVYRWYRPGGRTSAEQVIDVCTRFALAGIRHAGDDA